MSFSEWVRPAVWGIVGGAIAAMFIGFSWGGWVTGSTAHRMETASAKSAVIQAFIPLCVAKAEKQPEKLAALKAESQWKHDDFIVETGWVDNVSEKYRTDVARSCAVSLIEGMKSE